MEQTQNLESRWQTYSDSIIVAGSGRGVQSSVMWCNVDCKWCQNQQHRQSNSPPTHDTTKHSHTTGATTSNIGKATVSPHTILLINHSHVQFIPIVDDDYQRWATLPGRTASTAAAKTRLHFAPPQQDLQLVVCGRKEKKRKDVTEK